MAPRSSSIALLGFALALAAAGCTRNYGNTPAQQPYQSGYGYGPPGYGPPGYAPQGQYGPQGQYPQQPAQYPPGVGYPPPPATPPLQPGAAAQLPQGPPNPNDPINLMDQMWLRTQAGAVMGELIDALGPVAQAKVKGIPFVADPTVGDVNAFAACDDQGMPLMAITDGLLQIESYVAQFRATDEIFGTQKLDGYLQNVAQNQRPHQPIVGPTPGFVDPTQHADSRKVARQHQLFDEQLAFVLGHELSHHHLGHTGCVNGQGGSRGVNPGDLGRLLTRAMPGFNQPNEVAADISGVNNLLTAGARRQSYHWNEEGALLTLDFFARLDQLTPATLLLGFANTHPHPLIRRPIVQQAANAWRSTGGTGWQLPSLPNIFGAR